MGPKPQIVKTLEESKQELLETTVLQEKLSKIQGQLEKTFDESRVKYTKRVAKISDELAKILGKENQIQTSEPPLLKAVLRKTIERLTEKKTQLENRIADYEQDLTGVNERLIHRQMVDRDTNSPFTYKPLRSYFPERRSASVNRNNPYDLFQATFGHEKEYTYLDRASLQEMSESSGTEVDTLKQAAIKYVPVDIDKVSLTTWHKLGKHNTFTTHKALLNNVSVYQLNEDISYLKEVLLSTQPLERLNKKATWRVQLCNHPDHAGKVFVYRTVTTPNKDGKKIPMTHKSLAVYDTIISFLRSQSHASSGAQKDLEQWDDLLHILHTIRLNIKDQQTLPNEQVLAAITILLEGRKNHHLVTILSKHITKLSNEKHPERARNLLRGAENELLKRIAAQEQIQTSIHTQKQQANRMHNFVDLNRKRTGRDLKAHLRLPTSQRNMLEINKLLSAYRNNIPSTTFNPYKTFDIQIDSLMKNGSIERNNEIMKKKLQKLDILLSIHSLQYVILKWHDHARKSKTTIFPFPYQKRIAGTKGAIAQKYGRDSSLIFDTIEKELEQIDLLLNYPHASESDLLAHARYEDGEISVGETTTPLSLTQKDTAIKKIVAKIISFDGVEGLVTTLPQQE